jgi:hypothetical protein
VAIATKEQSFKFGLILMRSHLNLEAKSTKYFPIKHNFIFMIDLDFIGFFFLLFFCGTGA